MDGAGGPLFCFFFFFPKTPDRYEMIRKEDLRNKIIGTSQPLSTALPIHMRACVK